MKSLTDVQKRLFELEDKAYKAFQAKLIPTVPEENIIGVRTPRLRKYAKELFRDPFSDEFLKILPHRFYEENNLHAFLVEQIKDYDLTVAYLDAFLPYVDNWATCDMMSPLCFFKNTDKLYKDVFRWINSDRVYAKRFGICMLMKHYLGYNFKSEFLDKVASVKSKEYYVKMAVAWFFATALTKRYEDTVSYIEECKLDKWTHNKAINKACESYQITKERKEYLKTLKING